MCFEQILRLCMNGPGEQGDDMVRWPADPDLEKASLLGFILPFMQHVRRIERGSLTMDAARRTSIRKWIDSRPSSESRNEAESLYKKFEAAWNKAFGTNGAIRDGCGNMELPGMSDERPIAIACPMPKPPLVRGAGVIHLDDGGTPPEKVAAMALHELATKHNKMLSVAAEYCKSENARHIKYLLHQETRQGLNEDDSLESSPEDAGSHLMIHSAGWSDLLLFPMRYSSSCPSSAGASQSSPIQVNYHVDDILHARRVIPSDPNCPASIKFDLRDAENQLVFWLFASRRPLKVTSADHGDLDKDIPPFPYLRYHGNIDISTLEGLNARKGADFPEQQALCKAWGENSTRDLEYRLYMEPDFAKDILKLAGDLILIFQSVDPKFLGEDCKTVLDLVELYKTVGNDSFVNNDNDKDTFDLHPDSLTRVRQHVDVGKVPLEGLISLYLTALEQIVLASATVSLSGYSEERVENLLRDEEITEAPSGVKNGLAAANENPKDLNIVTRLLIRCLCLSEHPMPGLEREGGEPGCPLHQEAYRMNILDEIDENRLPECLPKSLLHWGEGSRGHTLQVFKEYRIKWMDKFDDEV